MDISCAGQILVDHIKKLKTWNLAFYLTKKVLHLKAKVQANQNALQTVYFFPSSIVTFIRILV